MRVTVAAIVVALLAGADPGSAQEPERRTLRVPSEAMVPTIPVGGRIEVNTGSYESAKPEFGDIVVAVPPTGADSTFEDLSDYCGDRRKRRDAMCSKAKRGVEPVLYVKRVVGLPGDRLSLRRGKLIRNGQRVDEPYTAPCDDRELCHFPRTITVPRGRYFLLGDNRGFSFDSRLWGPVPRARLARVDRCIPQPAVGCEPRP